MPPPSIKKGSARKKQRVSLIDCQPNHWEEVIKVDRYVVMYPGTQLICGCCFSTVEDMSQHINKASCCAIYLALRHVKVAYQDNVAPLLMEDLDNSCSTPFEDSIVSLMLVDDDCPLNAKDILAMPTNWKPNEKFFNSDATSRWGHTLAAGLLTKSFMDIYQDYVNKNTEYQDLAVPDLQSLAVHSTAQAYPILLKKYWKHFIDKAIKEEVEEGRLSRNIVEQAAPPEEGRDEDGDVRSEN